LFLHSRTEGFDEARVNQRAASRKEAKMKRLLVLWILIVFYFFGLSASTSTSTEAFDTEALVISQALQVLNQQTALLELLSDVDYSKRVEMIYNATVGGHIRHSINHFQTLLISIEQKDASPSTSSPPNYDARSGERNSEVEQNRTYALGVISSISETVSELETAHAIAIGFVGIVPPSSSGVGNQQQSYQYYSMDSTVLRELSFVAHHAVHHLAMIKLVMQQLDYRLG
jgi:hypothetical protein